MFVAVRIDINTAETFKHDVWYAKGNVKQRLDIVLLTLVQFQKYFVAMFEANRLGPAKTVEVPYLRSLPDEISFCADGRTLLHDRFGEGTVFAYIVVFKNHMIPLTYPAVFEDGLLKIE